MAEAGEGVQNEDCLELDRQISETEQLVKYHAELTEKYTKQLEQLVKRRQLINDRQQIHVDCDLVEGDVEMLAKAPREGPSCGNPVGASEVDNYINYLSDEIVEMILLNLKDPKDLANCSIVNNKFRKILAPTKPAWMFGEILPYTMEYLDRKDFQNCRLVCHSWKGSVDSLFETVVYRENEDSSCSSSYKTTLLRRKLSEQCVNYYWITFHTSDALLRLVTQVESLDLQNPFLGRRINFHPDRWAVSDVEYWPNVLSFLEKFGRYVWNCSMWVLDLQASDFIMTVRNCLLHLPNLKRLCLYGSLFGYGSHEPVLDAELIRENLALEPFPELPYLRELKLVNPPPYFYKVMPMSYWEKVQKLELSNCDYDDIQRVNEDILKYGLCNLKNLNLRLIPVDEFWPDLSSLHLLNCPLETLNITDNYSMHITIVDFSRLLHHFQQSLRHVKIEWVNKVTVSAFRLSCCMTPAFKLFLPNLQILELKNPNESLNFLKHLSSLQYFSILCTTLFFLNEFAEEKVDEIIQVHGYVERMYESNIWTYLTSLMEFKFVVVNQFDKKTTFYYTRDQYISSLKEKQM